MNKKSVVISVSNDLVTDQRVARTIGVLQDMDYEITLLGRKLPNSLEISKPYTVRRFKLWFHKGFLFYAHYNLRLFFFLLFKNYDIYFSNDLDTLLPNFLIAKLKSKKLIYDSHEYFLGVPEIQNRALVKKVWTLVEKLCLPHIDGFITVNKSIGQLYFNDYNLQACIIRNIGDSRIPLTPKTRKDLNLPEGKFILINQGAGINIDRGMEEALEALRILDNCLLLLVGKGDVIPKIKNLVEQYSLQEKVIFIEPKPYLEMLQYTLNADCGLSLDKNSNINYQYSLPNKLFDYIKSGIPIICSDIVEVSGIVKAYDIGELCSDHRPETIANAVLSIQNKRKDYFQNNLKKAAEENNWEIESKKLLGYLREIENK
tara:strand:- start:410 stop:1528 length:1119 start_codon:yes stop_codon:yes gene_type:complete